MIKTGRGALELCPSYYQAPIISNTMALLYYTCTSLVELAEMKVSISDVVYGHICVVWVGVAQYFIVV